MRVLLIEDEVMAQTHIAKELLSRGIVCDIASLGHDGVEAAKMYGYNVIILDLMLPDIDGYEVLLRIRSAKLKTPVIILSGINASQRVVRGLNLGADDYLTKPFSGDELVARIHSVLRRSGEAVQLQIKIQDFFINFDNRTITSLKDEKNVVKLTEKEAQVLGILLERMGTVLPKEEFVNRLYQYKKPDQANPKNIDVFVCKLRDKLKKVIGDDGQNPIETIWGVGYIFNEDFSQQKIGNADEKKKVINNETKHF